MCIFGSVNVLSRPRSLMSNIIRLTQEFYEQRREATDIGTSQEIIEANHVGWNSVENQIKSFEIATDLSWINWEKIESVLDVGCGYGKLLDFLNSQKFYKGKYCGIDIVPEFIKKAIDIHDNKDGNDFILGDFLEQNWNHEKFDFVISLGGLSVNHDYPEQFGQKSVVYAQKLISKIVEHSKLAISLYFPNADNIDYSKRKPRMAYHSTSEIEAMVMKACGKRCEDITFTSYPDENNVKTIAKIRLLS